MAMEITGTNTVSSRSRRSGVAMGRRQSRRCASLLGRSAVLFFALACFVATAVAQTPAKVTLSDQLFEPDGTFTQGTITVTSNQTFTSSDGYVVPQGQKITITLSATGTFSLALVPNSGATPTGTSYTVDYATSTKRFTETWVIPGSPSTVRLISVRALNPPTPALVIPFPQNIADPTCAAIIGGDATARPVPRWDGVQWKCGQANIGAVTLDLENPTGADSGKFQWKPKNTLTLTRISCSVDQGSASINLDIRQEGTPNANGSSALSSPLACGPSTSATTAFANASVPGLSLVALLVASTSGGVTVVRVHAEYQLNP